MEVTLIQKEIILDDFWRENWKLMEPKGGKKIIHARGCEYTKDWDMNGCRELYKFNPKKHIPCKCCTNAIYATAGAKDFNQNIKKYYKMLEKVSNKTVYNLYIENNAKSIIRGERLYIRCHEDNWYIDFSLGEIKLFHNNYNIKKRSASENWEVIGYHEHDLIPLDYTDRLNEAMHLIANYNFSKAMKRHSEKKKAKYHMTFSEYDAEYYGLKEVN